MTNQDAIKYLQQLYPNGGHCWLDEQRIEAINMAVNSLQEDVSEELEEACEQLSEKARIHKAETVSPFFSDTDYKQGVIDGANWQKEQFEKNRLKHCDSITEEQYNLEQGFASQYLDKYQRIPTFLDAIEYGMRIQKEQMMTNATEVTVHIEAGNYPYIPQIELYDYDKDIPLAKEGDKYKVVLIKENKDG